MKATSVHHLTKDIKVIYEAKFGEWDFEVEGEAVKAFRVYSDNVWELLNEEGNPIQQGWLAENPRTTRVEK